jgi:Ankyrin repeats (3 copies)
MSAVQKTDYLPDAATLDLWRVAEAGDLKGLASVLPRVRDINARNEHGVTALMRAAQFGHVKMVRALLEHGADANIKRNDKFTALALAAFFGHTEIVRALMEHGADSQAATRGETSPHMWATARTFNEVVNQLEKPAPVENSPPVQKPTPVERPTPLERPAPVARPAPREMEPQVATQTVVVRTLKDPPEIWDLVHEVPRGFNPRSAFLTRLQSTTWTFRLATVAVLIAAGVLGVMVFRRSETRKEANLTRANQQTNAPKPVIPVAAPAVAASSTASTADANTATPSFAAPEVNHGQSDPGINAVVSDVPTVYRKPRSSRGSRRLPETSTPAVAPSDAVQPVTTSTAKAPASEPQPKATAPLSSQMIAPAKTAQPKGKVIQWP